jgi:hypothetical protein
MHVIAASSPCMRSASFDHLLELLLVELLLVELLLVFVLAGGAAAGAAAAACAFKVAISAFSAA